MLNIYFVPLIRWADTLVAQGKRSCTRDTEFQPGGLQRPLGKCQPQYSRTGKFHGHRLMRIQSGGCRKSEPEDMTTTVLMNMFYLLMDLIVVLQIFLAPQGPLDAACKFLIKNFQEFSILAGRHGCGMRALIL